MGVALLTEPYCPSKPKLLMVFNHELTGALFKYAQICRNLLNQKFNLIICHSRCQDGKQVILEADEPRCILDVSWRDLCISLQYLPTSISFWEPIHLGTEVMMVMIIMFMTKAFRLNYFGGLYFWLLSAIGKSECLCQYHLFCAAHQPSNFTNLKTKSGHFWIYIKPSSVDYIWTVSNMNRCVLVQLLQCRYFQDCGIPNCRISKIFAFHGFSLRHQCKHIFRSQLKAETKTGWNQNMTQIPIPT